MSHRSLFRPAGAALLAVAGALPAACVDAPRPLAPPAVTSAPIDARPSAAAAAPTVATLREQLFLRTALDDSTRRVLDRALASPSQSPAACAEVAVLVELVLREYRAGRLSAQVASDPVPTVRAFVSQLAPVCDDVAPGDGLPAAAFGPNGAAVYIRHGVGGIVETPDEHAGVRVPAGAFDRDAILVITRRFPAAGENVLGTSLPQFGPFYDITTYPEDVQKPFAHPLDVGFVQVGPGMPTSDNVVIGHGPGASNPGGGGRTEDPQICVVPTFTIGRLSGPAYFRPSLAWTPPADIASVTPALGAPALRAPALRTPRGVMGAAFMSDSSVQRPVHCGQTNELSPFGLVQIYESTFNARAVVGVTATGRQCLVATNAATRDVAINYQAMRPDGTLTGRRHVLLLRGRAPAAPPTATPFRLPDAEAAGANRVRVFHGPLPLVTVALPPGPC